jgi:hypothetical protein
LSPSKVSADQDPDLNPAFHSNADPYSASKNENTYGSGFPPLPLTLIRMAKNENDIVGFEGYAVKKHFSALSKNSLTQE